MTPDLDQTLAAVVARLKATPSPFPNEQAVSQCVVLPVLSALGWDTADPSVVWPEYRSDGGRVDFALCDSARHPLVFIEVKHPSVTGAAPVEPVKQALSYAFSCGVPVVVLVDGAVWRFYLPAERGDYDARLFCSIDLSGNAPQAGAEALRRYLDRDRVVPGAAFDAARADHRKAIDKRRAAAAIPAAWGRLVEARVGDLAGMLGGTVSDEDGLSADQADLEAFLRSLRPWTSPLPRKAPPDPPPRPTLHLFGEVFTFSTPTELFVGAFRRLAERDPGFLDRFAADGAGGGRVNRVLGHSPGDLYPQRDTVPPGFYKEVGAGWLLATNSSTPDKEKLLREAARVARLVYGSDFVVTLPADRARSR